MDAAEFRRRGKEMIDYVADYLENVRDRRVFPEVAPGYLHELIPREAPRRPDDFDAVMRDVERVIMPGITHWHHPNFHAYYPTANSYPAIVADLLSDAIGCIGFTWASSPACTELEAVMMDWLAGAIRLPDHFRSGGKGGGVIQGTASEATMVALLAARSRIVRSRAPADASSAEAAAVIGRLVAYTSDESHCSVERACLMGAVTCRKVPSGADNAMTGSALLECIERDRAAGLVPFFVVATLGTTNTCAFDDLLSVGRAVGDDGDVWLHVDAAYAGSAFLCDEYRPLLDGVEHTDSYNFNPHKWMLVNFDCSAMWFKDTSHVVDAFNVDPLYLKHEHQDKAPDYRHWQIPLGRRFRSLKLWFVMRLNGIEGLQSNVRNQVALAKRFEKLVRASDDFCVTHDVKLGLVCFRIKGKSNEENEQLCRKINADGRIHLVASISKGTYFLRFAVCATRTEEKDIDMAWQTIQQLAKDI